MESTSQNSFIAHLEKARDAQSRLNDLYRDTIGLIDSLKNRSKKFMNQIANIEDGLVEAAEEGKLIDGNVNELTKDIAKFNEVIKPKVDKFKDEIDLIMDNINKALNHYEGEKGQLTGLLNARKRLLYLDITIRKIRAKVNSLQQMNNILFSFSEMFRHLKEEYKHNLSLVNTELAGTLEDCDNTLRKLDDIH